MKLNLVLKPCPWCRKTPTLWMPIEEDTWCWNIECHSQSCKMKPKSPHVSFRKSAKTQYFSFYSKLEGLCFMWNYRNPFNAFECKQIDLTQIKTLDESSLNFLAQDPFFLRIEVGCDPYH